ncbi:hypothetical protein H9P43_005421 [Blastocladiella emersonii ATCC 22665]|nr:hypothetical protein H9P43_005421 [Blastocladiella emersonii ATCC 22665]
MSSSNDHPHPNDDPAWDPTSSSSADEGEGAADDEDVTQLSDLLQTSGPLAQLLRSLFGTTTSTTTTAAGGESDGDEFAHNEEEEEAEDDDDENYETVSDRDDDDGAQYFNSDDEEYDPAAAAGTRRPRAAADPEHEQRVTQAMAALRARNTESGLELLLANELARCPEARRAEALCSAWARAESATAAVEPEVGSSPPPRPAAAAGHPRKRRLSSASSSSSSLGSPPPATRPRRDSNSGGASGPGVPAAAMPMPRLNAMRALRGREIGGHAYAKSPEYQAYAMDRFLPNSKGRAVVRYDSRPYSGQFSDDGQFFFACTQDFLVHLYDSTDPYDLREYKTIHAVVGQWTVTDATLNKTNDLIAYSSITPIVHVARTDVESDSQVSLNLTPPRESGHGRRHMGVWSLRFSADGRELVAATSANSIVVYDLEARRVVLGVEGHADDVNAVCFADASTNVLYSGSDDSLLKVWDRRSLRPGDAARPVGVLPGHTEGITYVGSRDDGRYVVSNGKDQCAKLWDIRKMMPSETFNAHPRAARDLRLDFDYRYQSYPLGAAGPALHRHPLDASVVTFVGHSVLNTLIRCHFAPGGRPYVVTGSGSGRVHVYNLLGECVSAMSVDGGGGGGRAARNDMFGWRRQNVCRDVAWHPHLPLLLSTSWLADGGVVARHEYTPEVGRTA